MLPASPTLDAWLDEQILQGRPGFAERARSGPRSRVPALPGPILVLCRSTATANSVRAWAARRTGVPGLDIVTPSALAHQLEGPWLDVDDPGPTALPSTPFAERIRSRPGLVALARQRVRELRLCRAAEPATPAPQWLETLADTEWFTDTQLETRLLELARANGSALTASLSWSRVVALGFDVPVDPWTAAIHHALTGRHAPEPHPPVVPTSATVVPDTAAEARVAARAAAAEPHDTLVLVQHDATAARVHRALLRNGIPSAWRPPARLERHTLASVIRRAVPWFAGASDPPIRAVDLNFVLRHPMVDSRLPPPALEWLEARLRGLSDDDDPEAPVNTRLSPREVAKIIKRARHLDAPLSRWIQELDALSHRTDEPRTASRALRLLARLQVLQACVRGETFQETFGSEAPEEEADWGDFDALVANLLGDQDPTALPETPPGGTLGALRRFLLACRVRTREDPASLRILGALRRGSEQPATRSSALELLYGTVDRGEVRPGVEILSYDDYDGRPIGQLILCDVHDQGVGARPAPDPLLTEAQLEALGVIHGRRRVTFRLNQLQRAVGRARSVETFVTRRDAMGRAVVAPVQLALNLTSAVQPENPIGTYGLAMPDLPESPAITALSAVPTATVPCPAPAPGPLQRHAIQASAEWARAGRGPVGARPEHERAPGSPTLTHLLVTRPTPASWLLPWLGVSEGVPEAALPDTREWSVSRLFTPLSHCLYQAFARTVLRIDEPETIAEELDPREIGNAVHDTLEHAALRGAWSVDGDVAAVREAFSDDLLAHTESSFDQARKAFGALSPARRAATRGLQERWAQHWGRYVASRVQRGVSGVPVDGAADTLVFWHWYLDAAVDALQEAGRTLPSDVQRSPYVLKKWIKAQSSEFSRGYRPQSERDLCAPPRAALPGAWAPVLEQFVQTRPFARVAGLWRLARELSHALKAPTRATVAELPFGERGDPASFGTLDDHSPVHVGPIQLSLGDEEVAVQGKIDRISVVEGPTGPLLRIVDYKTGRYAPSDKDGRKWITQLREPQLVIYALVVEQALANGVFSDALSNAQLATIGWDHLRVTDTKRALRPPLDDYLVDPATLNLLGRALGVLVGRARQGDWLLSPRSDTCPALTKWGSDYCPVAGACRIRAVDQGLPKASTSGGPQ